MAELKFRVQADYEKVQRLRDEITKLKQEIKGVDAIQDPTAFNKLNSKLQQTSKELNSVTNQIAQTSASVETDFKQKIFAASQSVNDFTEKIIAQKAVVRDIAADVSRLGEAYRSAARTSPMMAEDKLAEWKAAKKALDEEKAALFGLTQEQANARLSVKKLRDEYALLRQEGAGTEETMNHLTSKLKQMGAVMIGGLGLKELASRVISVRAEFESMETSLKVLLGGSQERLDSIMGQIKEYALASPLNTKDMVGAVQMMTSFGIEAEKSIDYLKAIGDVSMGDAGKFNSLALAFSQMSSAGKLMGQDLMQMVNAGFNPLEEISRKTGKSIGKLKEEMSKGAITSKMVQDAFISATSAGGKFFGMSSEGAKTLNGQISMLQESFGNMFNEIGGKGEGVVMTAVQMATKLVENYEQVGRVLLGLVETYGAYRVGLAVATVAQNGHTFAMTLARAQILITQKAQALLNTTMLANPYVLVASAIGVMIGALIMQRTQTDLVNDATKRYNEKKQEVIELEKRHNEEIQKLCNVAADDTLSTDNRRLALVKLEQKYPSIFKKYDTEAKKLAHIRDINAEIVELENKRSFANPKNEISRIDNRLKELDSLSKKKRLHEGSGTDNMGQQQMVEYAGLTKTEEAEKTALLKQKANLKKTIDKDKANNYLANVKEVDNASLARQINERNNLLAKMQTSGKKYGTVRAGGAKGVFSKDELDGQLKILRDEQARRQNKGTKKTKAELSEDKKKVQGELDGLTTDDAKGKKGAALRKRLRDIQAQEDLYSSSYDTKNKKSADDKKEKERKEKIAKAKEHQQMKDALDAKKLARKQAELDIENEAEQERINALEDGVEKTIATMKLAHKKELEQIDKQKQEYLKSKREEAKAAFDADPKHKDKVFDMSSVNLSQEEESEFEKRKDNIRKKHILEEKKHEDELIKANESYQDKKISLVKKYAQDVAAINNAITEAEKRGDKERVDALRRSLTEARVAFGKGQMSLAFEQLKKDPNYVAAFDDLKGASTDTLTSLIGRFQEVKQAAGEALDPEGVKTYFDAINGMIDELISRDPISMIKRLNTELIEQTALLEEAKRRRERIQKGEKIVKNVAYNKDLKQWVVTYWELAEAEADVAAKGQLVSQTTNKINKAQKGLAQTVSDLAGKMSELGGQMGGQTGQIFSMFSSIMSFYQNISDGITAVGRAGSGAMKAIESASVILTIISAAIQLMRTLNDILPNQDSLYEKAAQKQAEINKMRDSVDDYRLAVMKARHEEKNWFSDSGLQGLQDAYEEHGQVAEEYYKKLNEAQEQYVDKSSGLKKALIPIVAGVTAVAAVAAGVFTMGTGTVALGALGASVIGALSATAVTATVATAAGVAVAGLAGAIVGKAIDSAVSSIHYKNGQVAAKDNLRIQTRHRSFWRGQKTKDLREWVKEKYQKDLFDNEGLIDKELANEVLKKYGNKLQGEAKETLEKLVELKEKYDEFKKSIEEHVSKMYSPLVSDMTDAVWAWLKEGKDALSEFKNSAAKTFSDVAKDMIKQLLVKNVFNKYKDELAKLYQLYAMKGMNEEQLAQSVAKVTGDMMEEAKRFIPATQMFATKIREAMAAYDIDITGNSTSSQNASANGVSTITFEQASNIISLTTAGNISRDQTKELVNTKLSSIDISIRGLHYQSIEQNAIADELRSIQANSYIELQAIHSNTASMDKTLKSMGKDMSDIKEKIKNI